MLKNYMEISVDNILPVLLAEYKDVCKCPRCIEDIKAIALNNLKPWYVVREKGQIFVKINELETQFRTDTIKELVAAIEKVSANERHNL